MTHGKNDVSAFRRGENDSLGPRWQRAVAGFAVVIALVLAHIVGPGSSALAQVPGEVVTIHSDSREPADVAAAWSRQNFPCTAEKRACPSHVVISREDVAADALAFPLVARSFPLPGSRYQDGVLGPLLLSGVDGLTSAAGDELSRLASVTTAVILGGELAVPPNVEGVLQARGIRAVRVGGSNRIETAVSAARDFYEPPEPSVDGRPQGEVLLVRAYGGSDESAVHADVAAAGAYSGFERVPVLLTDSDELSKPAEQLLREWSPLLERVTIVGGEHAIGPDVEEAVSALGLDVRRVAGLDRSATAVAVAKDVFSPGGPSADPSAFQVVVLEDVYAPSFWASGLAAGSRGPLLYSGEDGLGEATSAYLGTAEEDVALQCGPLMREAACREASELLGLVGADP